ncbi:MAG: hypothetical protein ACLTBR_03445 [Anaerostipes sp.]|uniref:hypothetical protein n=1 Tax=Anaerostipes sp. TaxID=1872530 RepID=UPI003991032C
MSNSSKSKYQKTNNSYHSKSKNNYRNRTVKNNQNVKQNQDNSYFADYTRGYNSQSTVGQNFLLSPQILNQGLKDINMNGRSFTREEIERMVMSPHYFEQNLRQLSYHFYNSISIYKHNIDFLSSILDFDWEPIPYIANGKTLTSDDFSSSRFKTDYAEMTKFFNKFDVKKEYLKVAFNLCLYDTYYVSLREYDDHFYLQELPSSHCMIDSDSYLGYLFSFNLSYFSNSGVDIEGYSPDIRKKYANALRNTGGDYSPNLPSRNGNWVYWQTMTPDNSWVFKFNNSFAGSIPPILNMFIDFTKIDEFKDLEKMKKQLEAYKVIFATVPRLKGGRSGNKADDFSISATELGKFVATVKQGLQGGVDFKAAPLDDFKMFDFSPSASENNLLETEISNMLREAGMTDALLSGGSNISHMNFYKDVMSAKMCKLYSQFEKFCEYQINRRTKKYKFKIKFVGTIFDREARRKAANEDMERGIITPSIFSSRGIQVTDASNSIEMMKGLGFPDAFAPIKTASTMSSSEKELVGRNKKNDNELSESGEQTRSIGANMEKKILND